jgi:lysophospholipase L1-like esterase
LKPLVILAVFMTLVTSVFLLVAELALRTSYAERLYREVGRHPPHPFLQLQPGSQVEHVNAQGFRGDPIVLEKRPGAFRIFAIGGSTTLGVANPYAESYPFLLQSLLQERHPGVTIEVQNAGSAWYTTAHDLVAYEIEVRQYRPDVVIFFEAINDITRSFSPPWWAVGDFKPDYSHYLGPYIRMTGPRVQFMTGQSSWLTWNVVQRWCTTTPTLRQSGQ